MLTPDEIILMLRREGFHEAAERVQAEYRKRIAQLKKAPLPCE
jgi:hypothetical protein